MTTTRYRLVLTMLLGAVIPSVGAILLYVYFPDWIWANEPVHSVVEVLGTFAALLLVAIFLLLEKPAEDTAHHLWVACALIGMGVLDWFHAFTRPGFSFVWLHSMATLVGGVLFALVWLPARAARTKLSQALPWAVAGAAIAFGGFSLTFPQARPLMMMEGAFTPTAKAINLLGGVFFMSAAVRLAILYRRSERSEDLLLANLCVLFGLAAILFQFSLLWDAIWWFWHLVRLAAYFLILGYLFFTYKQSVERLLKVHEELVTANQSLQAELTERKRAEVSLQASHRFLEIAIRRREITPLLQEFVEELQKTTQCAAVAIRVLDAEGSIPYQAYSGFSPEFYELESPLSIKRDECICINVIKGTTDPQLPFYTPGGSFYMNATTRFLATVSEEEKGRTRNACNEFDYESVALVPIRLGDHILGLIHVADPKENMVSLQMVEELEGIAMQLAMALQRVSVREALEKLHRQHELILSSVWEAILGLDLNGNHTFVNSAAARMLGYEAQELIGRKSHPIWHYARHNGTPYPQEECVIYKTLHHGQIGHGEEYFWRKDGTGFWGEFNTTPIQEDGKVVGSVITFRDITERKRAEEAFQVLVNKAPMGIFIVQDGKCQMVNPGFEQVTGYTAQELLGHESRTLVHPDYREMVRETAIRMVKGELDLAYEFPIITKSGETRWVMEKVTSTIYQGQLATLGYFLDITEHKNLEAKFLQAQKMEAVGTLAGGIAHDFNNILTAIIGNVGLAKLDNQIGPRVQDRLARAEAACWRAQALSQQLLTFAKGGAPVKKLFSVAEFLTESTAFTCVGSPVKCETTFPENLWWIEGDPGQIDQVFQNLTINAIQAMPTGGTIKVWAENLNLETESNLPLRAGRYIKISVRDQGMGIPAEHLPRIFDPYFTTKQQGSG
ncbi:MAG: PAS domain S-box protein, partial [Proteobacteria bacterium]|nr:PAS domain S-box protein [Pseudomonadota bacterium]